MNNFKLNSSGILFRGAVLIFLGVLSQSVTRADAPPNSGYVNFYSGKNTDSDKSIEWVKSIAVSEPAYGSDIRVTLPSSSPRRA